MTIKTHNPQLENIHIEGRRGLWYVIDIVKHLGETCYILKHQTYGDLADHIVAVYDGMNKFSEVRKQSVIDHLLY